MYRILVEIINEIRKFFLFENFLEGEIRCRGWKNETSASAKSFRTI